MGESFLIESIADRLQAFHNLDTERDKILSEMVNSYQELKTHYDVTVAELQVSKLKQQQLQIAADKREKELLGRMQSGSTSNNFVMVAIDGDGALFQDTFFTDNEDGGADAAYQLHSEIQSYLKKIYPDANVADWSIVAQVFLNLPGLAAKMHLCGIIDRVHELQAFGRSFGHAQALFNFVDVGHGKERADHKIRETLRLYMPNAQCRHMLLGPCHDNGYLPTLEPYKRDPALASKITLIETTRAEYGFVKLGFKMVQFESVFRSEPLPGKDTPKLPVHPLPSKPVPSPPSTRLDTAATPTAPVAATRRDSSQSTGSPTAAHTPSTAATWPSLGSSSNNSNANAWVTVSKKGAGSTSTTTPAVIDIAPTPAGNKGAFTLLNKDGARLDAELPRPEPGMQQRLDERARRAGKQTMCNRFHLLGADACEAGPYCPYSHGERLPAGELVALRHKARGIVCGYGSDCRNVRCTCGHICRFGGVKSCPYGQKCMFEHTHKMNVQPAKRLYEDGTEEWLPNYAGKPAVK